MKIKRKYLNEIISNFLIEVETEGEKEGEATLTAAEIAMAAERKKADNMIATFRSSLITRSLPELLKLSQVGTPTLENPRGAEIPFITDDSPADAVKEAQRVLFSLRYELGDSGPAKNGIDGKFGTATMAALKKFRKDKGLSDDLPVNQVGPATAIHLLAAAKKLGKVAGANDRRPPAGKPVSRGQIPLEKVSGAKHEPFAMEPQIPPTGTDSWDPAVAAKWEELEGETQNFISSVPAAIASAGMASGESDAKDTAKDAVGSTYRDAHDQAAAVYNYPYKHDLRVRAQEPTLEPGDYFFYSQAKNADPERLTALNKALTALGRGKVSHGVYGTSRGSPYVAAFKKWEELTGGDKANHSSQRAAAVEFLKTGLEDAPEYLGAHSKGEGVDIPFSAFKPRLSRSQIDDFIDRISKISNTNWSVGKETDHYHLALSESIYDAIYGDDQ